VPKPLTCGAGRGATPIAETVMMEPMIRHGSGSNRIDAMMRKYGYVLLTMSTACNPGYPHRPATWPSAKSGDVCQGHGSVHEWDVFGNDMYVRCKDGTILAH